MQEEDKAIHLRVPPLSKVYFVSDLHLFCFPDEESERREKKIVAFLDSILSLPTTSAIFFLGDIFDFWMEYKHVVPKGNIRIQAKWLELKERNIDLYYFTGNHDMWALNYFSSYFGFKVFKRHQKFIFNDSLRVVIGHGDGLGPVGLRYTLFKGSGKDGFVSKAGPFFPPNFLFNIAVYMSKKSREDFKKKDYEKSFLGEDKEHLVIFCKDYLKKKDPTIDYFLFGHRHLPIYFPLNEKSVYINTGDWIKHFSYAVYDSSQNSFHLETFSDATETKAL